MALTKEQIALYGRQLILPELGVRGQERLRQARVLVVGAGGLGCPAATYLVAAGVGTVQVVDRDTVALSNLHRQTLHTRRAVGQPKSVSAAARLAALNPDVDIQALQRAVEPDTVQALVAGAALVVDGSDNLPTRYLVNDACVLAGIPLVYGGVVGFRGQVLTIAPRRSACFRCVFPEPPEAGAIPSCQDAGILGAAAGILGSLMAHEALKVLAGFGSPLYDRLFVFDGLAAAGREVPVRRDPACAVCGDRPTIRHPQSTATAVCHAHDL